MASTLPSADTCCDPCTEPVSVAVPGPSGSNGAAGAAGAAGANAFTNTTLAFTMPAELANVTITVASSAAFGISEIVYAQAGASIGYFSVVSKPSGTQLQLQNLRNAATLAYQTNSAPGAVFAIGALVTAGGLQGPGGTAAANTAPADATYITQIPNGTLTNEQSLSGLATGIMRVTTATGVITSMAATPVPVAEGGTGSANAAGARTALGVAIGTNVQAFDAFLASIAALGTAADKMIYTTGVDTAAETALTSFSRGLLAAASNLQARSTLGVMSGYGLLAESIAVNVNSGATDTALNMPAARYRIDKVLVENPSGNLSGPPVSAGFFTAAGGGGVTLAADQSLAALTATTKYKELTLQAIVGTDIRNEATLYFRVGTALGAAGTADVHIYGWRMN